MYMATKASPKPDYWKVESSHSTLLQE